MKIFDFLKPKKTEAAGSDLTEAAMLGVDPDDGLYRRITERDTKGLNQVIRNRALQVVFTLILKNPLARAMLEIQNFFINGDGFKFTFEIDSDKITPERKTEIIKQCMDKANNFWKINKMDLRFPKKTFDLSYAGMLIMPAFVNPINGEVRLGFIDAMKVKQVVPNILNVEDIEAIDITQKVNYNGRETESLKVIKTDINSPLKNTMYGLLNGECFYFSINNVSNQPEGVSDLLCGADWIDFLDQLMFTVLEHVKNASIYYDDVELQGFNDTQLKEWARKNPLPKKSSRFAHNEKLKRDIKTPQIKGRDFSDLVRIFKNFVLGSKTYPEHWFADGGNANKATATAQGTPTHRRLKDRQQYIAYILEELLTFVLHRAFNSGTNNNKAVDFTLTKEELLSVVPKIIVPDFETENLVEISTALQVVSEVIEKAQLNKWISDETAGKTMRQMFDMVGIDIDEESEVQKIEEQVNSEPEPKPVPPIENKSNNQNTEDESIQT